MNGILTMYSSYQSPLELEVLYTVPDPIHKHRIGEIGGDNWRHTESKAIANIESKACSYYVVGGLLAARAYLMVEKPNLFDPSTWFLKTIPDGILSNNLGALPSLTYRNALCEALKGSGNGPGIIRSAMNED